MDLNVCKNGEFGCNAKSRKPQCSTPICETCMREWYPKDAERLYGVSPDATPSQEGTP